MLEELNRGRARALRNYSGSLMSNTKWRIVFSTLKSSNLNVRQIIVKFTNAENGLAIELPWLHPPYPYVDAFRTGRFPLIDVEWIEIPATAQYPRSNNLPPEVFLQDVEAARAALEATGKNFPLQESASGLRIIGHVL